MAKNSLMFTLVACAGTALWGFGCGSSDDGIDSSELGVTGQSGQAAGDTPDSAPPADSTPPDSTPPDSTPPDSTPPDSTPPDSTPPESTPEPPTASQSEGGGEGVVFWKDDENEEIYPVGTTFASMEDFQCDSSNWVIIEDNPPLGDAVGTEDRQWFVEDGRVFEQGRGGTDLGDVDAFILALGLTPPC